jgi:predicted RNA-binding protein with PIN domain
LRIIIDGYNVIWAITDLRHRMLRDDSAGARLGLAALLEPVAQSGRDVTLDFDGAPRRGERHPAIGRVSVRFCREKQTADELIRELVGGLAEELTRLGHSVRARLLVVTSDRELADAVRGSGARTIGARAFVEEYLSPRSGACPKDPNEPESPRHHFAPPVRRAGAAGEKPRAPTGREVEEWLRVFGIDEDAEENAENEAPARPGPR